MNVGVIGLGMMGSQIALRLALKGHKVTVFNRDRSKAEKLHTSGATNLKLVNHPKEIGNSSDIAIICVKDYQAVADVSFKAAGLIETTNTDLIVIQCSTISPDESNKVADFYSNKQIRMLTVPMLGGTTAVERGEITLIGAGPKTAYELAMERLNKTAPVAKLSEKQKKELAELESKYAAKVAEREIFLKGELEKAAGRDDFEAYQQLEKQLASDRRSLQAELEEKKEKVRQAQSKGQ